MGDTPSEGSLRDALTEAYEQVEAPVDAPAAAQPSTESAPAPEAAAAAEETPAPDGRARDEKGRFAPKQAGQEASKGNGEAPEAGGSPPAAPGAPAAPVAAPVAPELKAPQSWKATVRERWAALPADVQAEVSRRERETAMALQEAAEARKGWQQFRDTVAPFEGMIRAEGGEPLRAVQSLLQTAAALRTAPPAHKAQLVANLVRTFGVPIEALDSALSGQSPPQGQVPGPYQDPRVDQLLQRIEAAEQQRTQAQAQRNAQAIESFAKDKDFFEDVRADMADILELKALQGVQLTLQQAYDMAVALHPDVSAALKQREAARAAPNAQASMDRARAAASSVKTKPAAQTNGAQPSSIRDYLEAAYEEASGR